MGSDGFESGDYDMRVLDLFSGIGGFSLGLERAGMETVAFCEYDEKCRQVLTKHWPDVPQYTDVRTLTGEQLEADGINVDVICGGFPCQDISLAGNGAGIEGERSGLWSEYARLISEIRPKYALIENVTALLIRGIDRVLCDLAQIGYDAEWHCIPASSIGANHRRDRVWIVAYPNGNEHFNTKSGVDGEAQEVSGEYRERDSSSREFSGAVNVRQSSDEHASDSDSKRLEGWESTKIQRRHIAEGYSRSSGWWQTEPKIRRVDDGIPGSIHRLKQLGNSVVPQIPEIIGRAIMELEQTDSDVVK